jgi:hypothetical protein
MERLSEMGKTTREVIVVAVGGQRGWDEDEGTRGEEDERRSVRSSKTGTKMMVRE